jgi:hypothetical protein
MQQPQNCERDVHRFIQNYIPIDLEKYYAPVRIHVNGGREDVMMFPMYPVHEFLGALAGESAERFSRSCFGTDGVRSLGEFWDHVKDLDWARCHPAYQHPELLAHTIPAAMFGDEGSMGPSKV